MRQQPKSTTWIDVPGIADRRTAVAWIGALVGLEIVFYENDSLASGTNCFRSFGQLGWHNPEKGAHPTWGPLYTFTTRLPNQNSVLVMESTPGAQERDSQNFCLAADYREPGRPPGMQMASEGLGGIAGAMERWR